MLIGGKYTALNIIPKFWAQPPVIRINQDDVEMSEMGFTIWNGNEQMDVSGLSAAITGRKPDGNIFVYDCTVDAENNAILVTVKDQMSVLEGKTVAEISLANQSGGVVHTWNFGIWVEPRVGSSENISETDIEVFQQILANAQTVEAAVTALKNAAAASSADAFEYADAASDSAAAAASSASAAAASARAAQQDFTEIDRRVEVLEAGRVYIGTDGMFYCSSVDEENEG